MNTTNLINEAGMMTLYRGTMAHKWEGMSPVPGIYLADNVGYIRRQEYGDTIYAYVVPASAKFAGLHDICDIYSRCMGCGPFDMYDAGDYVLYAADMEDEMHDALVKAGYDGVMMDDRDGSVNGRIYYLFDKSLAERKEKVR